ncbi:anaphase-promoting complex subunit cdc27 [Mortierella claussenii]|nr:anaphase-promoting complex subunit cdc27 [Mortierella claussenii]
MAVMATSAGSSAEGFGSATGVYQSARPRLDSAIVRLESIIQYSLDKFQFRNALFLAERLLSQVRGYSHSELEREHARYLLATCHYRQGKPEMAWAVLEGSTSVKNRFLFAQCCLDLRRYVEGAGMLEWLLEEGSLPKHSSTGKLLILGTPAWESVEDSAISKEVDKLCYIDLTS